MCWDDIFDDADSHHEDEVEDPDIVRSQPDDEESSKSTVQRSLWWVSRLASRAAGYTTPSDVPAQRLVSGCTGCSAESEVMKAKSDQNTLKTAAQGRSSSHNGPPAILLTC